MHSSKKTASNQGASKRSEGKLGGASSHFVIINGLKTVQEVRPEEIHAIEAHYWAEINDLLGHQAKQSSNVNTQNAKRDCSEEGGV